MRIVRAAFAGLCGLLVSGCPQIAGLFGPTPEEQVQLRQLRGMQQTVAPGTNVDLKRLVKGLEEILAMRLPTYYGTDILPYLQVEPWPPIPAQNQAITAIPYKNDFNDPDLGELRDATQRQWITFLFNGGADLQGPSKSMTYLVTVKQTIEGVTGTMTIQTEGRTAFQRGQAPAGQPHKYSDGRPATFGRRYTTASPVGIQVTANLQRGGTSLGDVRISLREGDTPSPTGLLRDISLSGTLPRMTFSLNGRVSPGGISFSNGSLGIHDGQQVQNLVVTSLRLAAKSLSLSAEGQEQGYSIDLDYQDGKLSGKAKSTNPQLRRELARVSQTGNQAEVKYLGQSQPEPWR